MLTKFYLKLNNRLRNIFVKDLRMSFIILLFLSVSVMVMFKKSFFNYLFLISPFYLSNAFLLIIDLKFFCAKKNEFTMFFWAPLSFTLFFFVYQDFFIILLFLCGMRIGSYSKSFLKKYFGLSQGGFFIFFDQLDFVLPPLLLAAPFLWSGNSFFIFATLLTLFMHPLSNILAHWLRIKNVPW
jgi:hypothetical protein